MRRVALALAGLGLAYILFWPIPLDPRAAAVTPPPAAQGILAPNDALSGAELVAMPGGAIGPEDIAAFADGRVYTTVLGGGLYRIDGDEGPRLVEELGGRPLGLDAGPDGALYIADSFRGILRWQPGQGAQVLADRIDGAQIVYANQLDVARDGTVYFSNSSDRFDPRTLGGTKPTSVMTIWEQSDTGYVARVTPSGAVERVATGFVYTNGVALSPEEDFLIVAETGRARLHRVWLQGDRKGQTEVLVDSLPGYPDNIEPVGDGTYWVALASPRVAAEALMAYPFLRRIVWRLGPSVRPAPVAEGQVIQIDGSGRILRYLRDATGRIGLTTGASMVGDLLHITTLDSPHFARIPATDLPPRSQ